MKIKTLILALLVCIMAISVYAQNEKVTVKYNNVLASQAIEDLFKNYQKDFYYENGLSNGMVTLNLTDKPFDVVLTAILNQINATFEYKDGVYRIMPDPSKYSTGMGTAGRTGIGVTPGVTPGGVAGGIGQPTLVGGQTGAGVNPGLNPGGMGTGRGTTGMGGTQGTLKPRSFEDPIMKIRINYNSPYQILSLMDGDDYTDVVWNNSGNSGSSNNNNSNNNNNNNNNNNSSSRSSRSSNR